MRGTGIRSSSLAGLFAWSGHRRPPALRGRAQKLWLAFQPRDAVFVSLNDLEKGGASIPQRTDLPGMLVNLPRVLENRSSLLDNLPGLFLTLAQKQFDRLRQGFMPFGQPIQAFVDRHKPFLRQRSPHQSTSL